MIHDCVNDDDFYARLADAGEKPVIVDFYATWCGPCSFIAPTFEQLAEKFGENLVFLKVDVDKCAKTSDKYGVNSLPTFQIVKDSKAVEGEICQASKPKLEELVIKWASK